MELYNYRLLDWHCWKFGIYFYLFIYYFFFLGELKRLNDINFNKSLLIIDYINNLDYSPYYINFTDKNQPILN